jgi:hypothetical protein
VPVAQASPSGQTAGRQLTTGVRFPRIRQLAWAAVPLLSVSLLAFAPFLCVALIRRRARDWQVLASYAAAVVVEVVLVSAIKPGSAASDAAGTIAGTIGAALIVVATVHALAAFRPAAGLPSWRDVHAIRAAPKLAEAAARQADTHARAAQVRAAQGAARAAVAEAKAARTAERAKVQAAADETKRQRKHEAHAASAEARSARKAELAAARGAAAEVRQRRRQEKADRKAAAQAAKLAGPRYGWVETRRTYRRKTIFGNRRTETVVTLPPQRNARRRTRQRFGVTITEEWRRLN